jgi:hexosaminidase
MPHLGYKPVFITTAANQNVEPMNLLQFFLFIVLSAAQVLALWPIPRSLQTGSSFVKLSPSFDIELNGISKPPSDLVDAISRTMCHLKKDRLQRLVVGRGDIDRGDVAKAPTLSKLKLSLNGGQVRSIMEEATKPIGNRSEEYSLSVPSNGDAATISAKSTLGLLRGLTTFEQLFYFDGVVALYTHQAPVTITDSPAYACLHSSKAHVAN